jgi:prepilin-type N-terminal cleavage/methylation domain-containing protein
MTRVRSLAPGRDGFSLIETLVSIVIAAVVSATVVQFLLSSSRYHQEESVRLEVNQGLRATLDALVRDVRIAGSCLSEVLTIVKPLEAKNSGTRDEITLRIGLTTAADTDTAGNLRSPPVCIRTSTIADFPTNTRFVNVSNTQNFLRDMRVHLVRPNGDAGQEFTIVNVTSLTRLELDRPPAEVFPGTVNTGITNVYAFQERRYRILEAVLGTPKLFLTINDGTEYPQATGIERLDVSYRMQRNCPPCDTTAEPTAAELKLVTDVVMDVEASLPGALRSGVPFRIAEKVRAKPRNLLPPTPKSPPSA